MAGFWPSRRRRSYQPSTQVAKYQQNVLIVGFPVLIKHGCKKILKKHSVRCLGIINHGCKEIKKNTQCWIFHHYQPGLLKLDNTKRSLLNFSLVLIMDTKKYNSKKKHNNKNRNMQNNTHCHPSPHGRSLVQIVHPVQSPLSGSRQTPPC